MENASKALIIAGAILLSILIIGIGMTIYRQASGALDGANMDEQEIMAFNSKFEEYEGTIRGTKAKALVNTIENHNRANTDDVTRQVLVTYSSNAAAPATSAIGKASELNASDITTGIADTKNSNTGIKTGNTYDVSFTHDPDSGLIIEVLITVK